MATLQERLDRIKAGFNEKAPDEAKAVMARATQDLRDSGIMDGLPSPGSPLAPFELPDTEGAIRTSADLLDGRPGIVTFYRGNW